MRNLFCWIETVCVSITSVLLINYCTTDGLKMVTDELILFNKGFLQWIILRIATGCKILLVVAPSEETWNEIITSCFSHDICIINLEAILEPDEEFRIIINNDQIIGNPEVSKI